MGKLATPRVAWPVLMIFFLVSCLACAANPSPRPKVQVSPQQYPHFQDLEGVAVAVVPFDGWRDVYGDPRDSKPSQPDFDWLRAGVRPTRIILANESQQAVFLDPSQITCVDDQGVSYQVYAPREAGDAVVSSEAFQAYLRGGLKGALIGGALGAGLGAALGAVSGCRGYAGWGAARGAAWGGTFGGVQGLFVGAAGSRAELEHRVRHLINTQQFPEKVLSPGMTQEGLVFFPTVPMKAVRLVLVDNTQKSSRTVEIPVFLPPLPVQVSRLVGESEVTRTQP